MTTEEIEDAARLLNVTARLEGSNNLVLLDVALPAEADAALRPAMHAARALHRTIQVDDDLADIEETLEDALKAGDRRAIDDGCEMYRALLASRLRDVLSLPEGEDRIRDLANSDR